MPCVNGGDRDEDEEGAEILHHEAGVFVAGVLCVTGGLFSMSGPLSRGARLRAQGLMKRCFKACTREP